MPREILGTLPEGVAPLLGSTTMVGWGPKGLGRREFTASCDISPEYNLKALSQGLFTRALGVVAEEGVEAVAEGMAVGVGKPLGDG